MQGAWRRGTGQGMGAILMNDCVIGENCVIGAGTLVPERMQACPPSMPVAMRVTHRIVALRMCVNREGR